MNIIVFGGTGFLGGAFVTELRKNPENHIQLVVRKKTLRLEFSADIDYSEAHLVVEAGITYDQALDFASHVSVDDFITNPQKAFLENLEIPIKNIKFLNQLGFSGRYNYISTDRAVLNISNFEFMSELSIPNDPYGASKLIGEMISRYSYSLGLGSASIVRFPNLYGPKQNSKQLIPTIVNKIKNRCTEIELTSLSGSRNYLFVSDAVNALIKIVSDEKLESEICFSGTNYKIKEIVDIFKEICNQSYGFSPEFFATSSKSKRSFFKDPPLNLEDAFFRERYAWFPQVAMQQGLLLTLEAEH